MRSTLIGLIVLVGSLPCFAQPEGERLSPKNGHFSIHFPGKPKETNHTPSTDLGDLKIYTATYATAEGSTYLVSYFDMKSGTTPENRPTLYRGLRDGLLGKKGKLVSPEKEIAVGPEKLPGIEVVVDMGKEQTRFRFVLKGNRLFQIGVTGEGKFVTGEAATAFLDSFEFTK